MTKSPMLLPRFTIRTLLVLLTICAIVFVLVGTAFRGQYWAWGVTIAIVSLIVTALTHVAWFGIVWLFARLPSLQPGGAPTVAPAALPRRSRSSHPADGGRDPFASEAPSAP
jgi:hypothetical protein